MPKAGSPGRRSISRTSLEPRSEVPHRRKLYGRRKGPSLSARQAGLLETLLPKLAVTPVPGRDPKLYFSENTPPPGPLPQGEGGVTEVWLEIGFGAGEHLIGQAEAHPDIGIIGVEPYVAGMAKLLSKLVSAAEGRGGGRGGNIRLYTDDARDLIAALPEASLGRVFILFPDPWPKARHHKRRFIQTEMLDKLARVMRKDAELRFATDDRGYLVWALERLMSHNSFKWMVESAAGWRARPSDWPETRYEAKAKSAGRACTYLRFMRV
jgi:tRNA (guanine-N7-)-methyltransferase